MVGLLGLSSAVPIVVMAGVGTSFIDSVNRARLARSTTACQIAVALALAADGAAADGCAFLAEFEGDAGCRPLVLAPHRLDSLHEAPGCGGRLPGRGGGAIDQAELAKLTVAIHPL